MKITLAQARKVGKKLGLDFHVVPVGIFRLGMQIELEHGTVHERTNITDNNLIKTGKIVLAHLLEHDRYYQSLVKMESQLKRKKKKPVLKNKKNK